MLVSAENNATRRKFFEYVLWYGSGNVCLATIPAGDSQGVLHQNFFRWPHETGAVLSWVNKSHAGRNTYFSPHLFGARARRKEHVVEKIGIVWADLDACHPEKLDLVPSVWVETSPNRFQGYWRLREPVAATEAEDASHRLAAHYRALGVDQGGWDLTQLLRVPLTYNMKPAYEGANITVGEPIYTGVEYTLTDFEIFPAVEIIQVEQTPIPDVTELDPNEIIKRFLPRLDERTLDAYNYTPNKDQDWSKVLFAFEIALLRAGMSVEETFAVASNAACNKFARDKRAPDQLWRDVLRAKERFDADRIDLPAEAKIELITEKEQQEADNYETFIDRYFAWANEKGDAYFGFHIASGFMLLSATISPSVIMRLQQIELRPNLWWMLVGESTLSRKTTSMKYALSILNAINRDLILATDGSSEGLLTALSKRPGMASVFYRDEVGGMLNAFQRKDYLSSMPELLADLYEGGDQKRVLRKEEIDVREPVLLMFTGGVTEGIFNATSEDFITSGFFPRFLFILGNSDEKQYAPLSLPTSVEDKKRLDLIAELEVIRQNYDRDMQLRVPNMPDQVRRDPWSATPTQEALDRYNAFERALQKEAKNSTAPHLFGVMFDRLAKSVLKMATLIAASSQNPHKYDGITVELRDVVKAISYAPMLRDNAAEILKNANLDPHERRVTRIEKYVQNAGSVKRSELMRRFRLSARDAEFVAETLEQRGLILRSKRKGLGEEWVAL